MTGVSQRLVPGAPLATLVKLGIFASVAVLAFAIIFETMKSPVGGPQDTYTAIFNDVSGLRSGDAVRVAGVTVGKVSSIDVVDARAKVTISLKKEQPIRDDAKLVVRYQDLVGRRYLDLEQTRGAGGLQDPHNPIPISRTSAGFDLTELLNGFRPLFDVLDPAEVNTLSATILKVLQGEGGTIPEILRQTTQLTQFVADRDAVFGRVLDNLTPFLQDLAGRGDQFTTTVTELRALMTGLAKERGTIGASIEQMSTLLSQSADFLVQAEAPARTLIRNLRSGTSLYADNVDTFKRSIVSFTDLVNLLGRTTSYRNALNVYICKYDFFFQKFSLAYPIGNNGPYSKVCGG